MRNASFTRHLKPKEIELARNVFHSALPPWNQIGITDGLGKDDTVWTMTRSMIPFAGAISSSIKYYINFGDAANVDLSVSGVGLGIYVPGYGEQMSDVFVHELTHVWQYSRPYAKAWEIAGRCVYAQKIGAGYRRAKPGDRTQMGLVYSEYWFADVADLAQLKVLLDGERMPVAPEPEPITAKDDSFVVVLTGDVLFDFNKADLKPAADWPLEQAWTKSRTILPV